MKASHYMSISILFVTLLLSGGVKKAFMQDVLKVRQRRTRSY
jgi:hypothetical protein